ncbi:bifunctional hydroxymethylpyrimidine kinase/phosphomethylpyrimidine kinase [Deminuibacter soli]|uniref:hydroxymethylpyrimidine kinase n=1 Tax=Deminuibacter soli TaxID=2291815 RepID=A0A3E1NL12_9BACT|nr:bifunctional hydroxymethylpyrimidine kinase/phosphomethylpyrimidine kinase [Deminuibacter soli]RFM28629.1 bifunctional hydroxymethylpyrimidine kinase/phosphomethylpyrimidine kinase [Deminuibacter soli]
MQYKYPAVLTIAGSDSGGGAGIQADIKTIAALGCYATTAITAITVQNTLGVTGIHDIPPAIVRDQIQAVMEDIAPVAVKTGMLHTPALALAVAEALRKWPQVPVVLDPVMVATSGDRLIQEETIEILKTQLFPLATVITPNLDEVAVLTGIQVRDVSSMREAAARLLQTRCQAVLIKGGHLPGKKMYDVLLQQNGEFLLLEADYVPGNNVHGTGCTMSSAIAAYLAQEQTLATAVSNAKAYITAAIAAGADVVTGKGHGPLNHFYKPVPTIKYEMERTSLAGY